MTRILPSANRRRSALPSAAALALPLLLLPLFALPADAAAQDTGHEWCREGSRDHDHCEVREFTLQARGGALSVNARPNGSIQVEGWDGSEVRVVARVTTRARTGEDARSLAREVDVQTEPGRIRTEGPRMSRMGWGDRESWSVSYRVLVPTGTNLDLESLNGSIRVAGVNGGVSAQTTNGSVRLTDVDGGIRARSTNGAIQASFRDGFRLQHDTELRTTNGSVTVQFPSSLSARLEASTTNGSIHTDIPLTVQGRIGRRISAVLGDGGPDLVLRTTNGSVRLRGG